MVLELNSRAPAVFLQKSHRSLPHRPILAPLTCPKDYLPGKRSGHGTDEALSKKGS